MFLYSYDVLTIQIMTCCHWFQKRRILTVKFPLIGFDLQPVYSAFLGPSVCVIDQILCTDKICVH